MNQDELNHAVAQATGESLEIVESMGFSLCSGLSPIYDHRAHLRQNAPRRRMEKQPRPRPQAKKRRKMPWTFYKQKAHGVQHSSVDIPAMVTQILRPNFMQIADDSGAICERGPVLLRLDPDHPKKGA